MGRINNRHCKGGDFMITNLTNIPMTTIYDTFTRGFSDYPIKLDMTLEEFETRFFGSEGNQTSYSHIVYDHDEPNKTMGLIFGGIRQFDGIKTLRCGTMCVDPSYRRKGVGEALLKTHLETAKKECCKQTMLEVLSDNYKAIALYKKMGYDAVYHLKYYTIERHNFKGKIKSAAECHIKQVTFQQLQYFRNTLPDIHINWQNEFDYVNDHKQYDALGVYDNKQLIGGLGIVEGKIHFLWLNSGYRNVGIGSTLIEQAFQITQLTRLNMSFPSNVSLQHFVNNRGFAKNPVEQYEMYKII